MTKQSQVHVDNMQKYIFTTKPKAFIMAIDHKQGKEFINLKNENAQEIALENLSCFFSCNC